MPLMSSVKCPHCGEEHSIQYSNDYRQGWNVVQCLQNTDDCEVPTRGCRKYFNILCALVAIAVKKVVDIDD